ncbi:MAG TPA: penicillin-binding protein [Vicinamibacterales bacterium]|nr:penicillin-binding protein [Vicinamibacterales bacterium]
MAQRWHEWLPGGVARLRDRGRRARVVRRRAPAEAGPLAWRARLQGRVVTTAVLFAVWGGAIQARLIWLQVVQHDELSARAERQQMRTVDASAKRGEILDRNGHVLAYSVDAESVYAVPTEIKDPAAAAARLCAALDDCDARERQKIEDRLGRQRPFAFVRRQLSPQEARRIAALQLEGVGFIKENRRYYPRKELAAHVIGYAGVENIGLAGIESAYDKQIRGRAGRILIQTDARRHTVFSRVERPATSGADVELAIDEYLQYIAERELGAAVREHRAAGGTIIIMAPRTGEILALANYPTYNPNTFSRYPQSRMRNRAIQEIYEPGSTFKIVTASAAFEESLVDPDDPVDASGGRIAFGARVIHDTHDYGVLSFTDVVVKSSNVGAIRVALKLGPERLSRYVRRFGFGQALSPELGGESPGIVWNPAQLNESALASIAMGYQVGVTPLQMAAAVSSIANGGELVEPHVVRAVIRNGRRIETPRNVLRRTVSPSTAAELTSIMEAVVERGTGRAAQLDAYRIAGKTGTAAKLVAGRYSNSDYNASFVGFVPSRRPALTILVVIDAPHTKGYYGGVVAAPVFKRVAEAALRHLGVPPTTNPLPPVLVARRADGDLEAVPRPARAAAILDAGVHVARDGLMPDLRGLGAREAMRISARLGLVAELRGSGVVAEQSPAPGALVERGATCRILLHRNRVVTSEGGQRGGATP